MRKYIEADELKLKVNHEMDMQDTYLPAHFFDIVDDMPAADVQEVVWKPCDIPPPDGRNVFLAHGTGNFKSCCIGHYDHEMGIWYEDRNFFARPIYDCKYWCDMPHLPKMDEVE